MSMLTPWGYTLTTATSLTDFLTTTEFGSFTNSKFTGDSRVSANISPATRSIQNFCGWHIYPALECEMVFNMRDLRDAFVGSDLLIQMPATLVNSVTSILLDAQKVDGEWTGEETTDFDLNASGLIRVYDVGFRDRRSKIRVVYNAGLAENQMDVLKELTAHRVVHAVSSSYGITSEAAGGVSVTYNASWAGNTRASALPDDNKEILASYKVRRCY